MELKSAWIAVVLMFFFAVTVNAATMRCNGMVVSLGETKAEVAVKCGEPASRDSREEEVIDRSDGSAIRIATVTVEDWTYDFGPDSLIRVLIFRNNRLEDIRDRGYGSSGSGTRKACDEPYPDPGASRSEIIARCGEPSFRDVRQEEALLAADANSAARETVTVEEWTYNLGPDRLIRIFELRNGKLVRVRTGGYGR